MTDSYTRAVLGIVAVCLVLLVAQGFGLGRAPAEAPAESSTDRFRIMAVPALRSLLRFDGQTGETWRAALAQKKGAEMKWESIGDAEEEPLEAADDGESTLGEEAAALRREVESSKEKPAGEETVEK